MSLVSIRDRVDKYFVVVDRGLYADTDWEGLGAIRKIRLPCNSVVVVGDREC